MQTGLVNRIKTILIFFAAQASLPLFALFLIAILLIYLINFLFIQPDKLEYLSDSYLEILITITMAAFFTYAAFMISILNAIKFGHVRLVSFLINKTGLITPETKLYFYNLTGRNKEALEIAKKLDEYKIARLSKVRKLDRRTTIKLFIADTYIFNEKYNKALKLLESELSLSELDIIKARQAQIALKKDNNVDQAVSLALEAININQNEVVRNAEAKFLEINLILADIYIDSGKPDEAYKILYPWHEDINKYAFYYYCKYNKYFVALFYYTLAKVEDLQNNNSQKVIEYLKKCILIFPESRFAKDADKLLAKYT